MTHRAAVPKPALAESRRIEWSEPVSLPRLDVVWLTEPCFSAEEPALDFAAHILGGRSKESRLKRRLVHDDRLVNTVGGYHWTSKHAGQFGVRAFALPNVPLPQVEAAVDDEVLRLCQLGPTMDEMARTRFELMNQAYSRLETVLGRTETLGSYVYYQGRVDPNSVGDDLARYERVTAADVREAALKYLSAPCVKAVVLPSAQATSSNGAAEEASTKKHTDLPSMDHLPKQGQPRAFRLPDVERWTAAGGLKVLLVRRSKVPRVDAQLLTAGGAAFEPIGKLGLARLTADVIDEGTESLDSLALARQLDLLGSAISSHAGVESSASSMRTLSENLEQTFALFCDVSQRPRIEERDFERERARLLAELAYRSKQPGSIADDAIDASIFSATHPYGRPVDGVEQDVASIASEDVRRFHQERFSLAGASLLVVGDVDVDRMAKLVDSHLLMTKAAPPDTHIQAAPTGTAADLKIIARRGAAQAVIRVGRTCIERTSPYYFPLLLVNTILGGQFSSRLNINLRETNGYTYGARSSLATRRFGGSFVAGADVGAGVVVDAVREMLREIVDVASSRPITDSELHFAKAYLTRRFPARFETNGGVAGHLAQLELYGLPIDYYDRYSERVDAVTLEEAAEAARRSLDPTGLKVVVVGDAEDAAALRDAAASVLGRDVSLEVSEGA
jgi:zinc protease